MERAEQRKTKKVRTSYNFVVEETVSADI